MEKEFVPYEQALALKELGFDKECFAFYSKIYGFMTTSPTNKVNEFAGEVILPLYQQAFRWFREKHSLQSIIVPFAENSIDENSNTLYYPIINKKQFYGFVNSQEEIGLKTSEEAELECLVKLIEIVKNDVEF